MVNCHWEVCAVVWPRIRHTFLWKNIPSSADSRRASCRLLAKEWTLYTGKLPLRGLPRNNVVLKVTDHPDMTKKIPSSADSRRASCQLLAKEWTLYTGKLPLGGLPRNNVVLKVTDHPDTISAVYFRRKASTGDRRQTKQFCFLDADCLVVGESQSSSRRSAGRYPVKPQIKHSRATKSFVTWNNTNYD